MTSLDRRMLTFQRTHYTNFITDNTVHYDDESCLSTNWRQLWNESTITQPPKRMYICKASYYMTDNNQPIVDGLACIPPQKFNFSADMLCVAIDCDVRFIKTLNVAAGLVNSATGTVVGVVYSNADCKDLVSGKHPPPYCIVVNFPGFQVSNFYIFVF